MDENPPRLFVSYSHDSQRHINWVLQLATRLRSNGVDVLLDRWNVGLGGNLPLFMETGSIDSERVLAVCTSLYVRKANDFKGGVGYERTILTARLMKDQKSERIIPLIRDNDSEEVLPTFLLSRKYIDFRDDNLYEAKYAELIHEIHGKSVVPIPQIGKNPFLIKPTDIFPIVSQQSSRYVSPALHGRVSFNYSNNNGCYVIGAGDMVFETYWSEAGHGSIYALNDPPSIRTVALAEDIADFSRIADATQFDASSRHRTAKIGDSIILQNTSGYYAAVTIESVTTRRSLSGKHELVFFYAIQSNKSADFSTITLQ